MFAKFSLKFLIKKNQFYIIYFKIYKQNFKFTSKKLAKVIRNNKNFKFND